MKYYLITQATLTFCATSGDPTKLVERSVNYSMRNQEDPVECNEAYAQEENGQKAPRSPAESHRKEDELEEPPSYHSRSPLNGGIDYEETTTCLKEGYRRGR